MRTSRPADATASIPPIDGIAPLTHYSFYVLVLLVVGTGYVTAIRAGLNRTVFQGSSDPRPRSLADHPTFVAHGCLAALLAGTIGLHMLAALYLNLSDRMDYCGACGFGVRFGKRS